MYVVFWLNKLVYRLCTIFSFVDCETKNKLRHFGISSGISWPLNMKPIGFTDLVKEMHYRLRTDVE